ncbi:hypothetical protein F2Q69_00043053 [Brassica cretica]|uniref:Uncharacterized protein n=1 Tax=Brassica cretica TaxID=69181 RepID=A0A8S9NEE1_BRACR|nr:hypothetical protein F2Q69_00043053 [Brassica cretica]
MCIKVWSASLEVLGDIGRCANGLKVTIVDPTKLLFDLKRLDLILTARLDPDGDAVELSRAIPELPQWIEESSDLEP